MWIDISRGIAVLRSAWNVSSADRLAETAAVNQSFAGGFLQEAQNYMNMGRHQSAAILAGDALDETLRKLCSRHRVSVPGKTTIDNMNAELTKKGVYDEIVGQRVSEAASLCDKANCGLWSEFSKDDVESLLRELRAFALDHPTN